MSSLSTFDEFAIHQTPEPILFPSSSDRNIYDRNWFGGFDVGGQYYFGFTIGIYPNRGVIDCGFSILDSNGVQHCLLASGRAPDDRRSLSVGPVTMMVAEPMRKIVVTIAENESGIHGELTFTAHTAAVKEPRQVMWSGVRRTTDTTRYNQYGRWSGWVQTGEGLIEVDPSSCYGVKDRSWGVRRLGEPEPAGPIAPNRPMFLWSQLFWDDSRVTHALLFDDAEGRPLVRDGARVPIYASPADIPGIEDDAVRSLQIVGHEIEHQSGTRWIQSARITVADESDSVLTIEHKPLLRFHQRGVGYSHPRWPHGVWQGESVIDFERYRPDDLDPTQRENFHVQHLVRVTDGEREGVGILEHFIQGSYRPAGLTS